ncbi:hypothetical protein Lal_00021212 [Lupinus albus]|nr:hypothetical protein Lal_00021212 [Lupinus albus]
MDFGALFHVSSRIGFFHSYISGDFGHVKISKIMGHGNIFLKTIILSYLVLKYIYSNVKSDLRFVGSLLFSCPDNTPTNCIRVDGLAETWWT